MSWYIIDDGKVAHIIEKTAPGDAVACTLVAVPDNALLRVWSVVEDIGIVPLCEPCKRRLNPPERGVLRWTEPKAKGKRR